MAIVIDNIYTKGISGRIGDSLLYKQYGPKTVVTRFPQRTLSTPSQRQLAQRKKFALAVLQTRQWLKEAPKRQFLLGLKHKWRSVSAYHAGIKYFMLEKVKAGSQKLAVGSKRLEFRDQKLEVGSEQLEVGSERLDAKSQKLAIRDQKLAGSNQPPTTGNQTKNTPNNSS